MTGARLTWWVGFAVSCALAPACVGQPVFLPGASVGNLSSSAIVEASGLAASRLNADVLYVHNDSGDVARFFAINTQAQLVGTFRLTGVSAVDWEDIAVGPGPAAGQSYVYVGDIGDNNAVRTGGVYIYRVPEPTVSSSQSPPVDVYLAGAERITLLYPGGPRDAETLMIDPLSGDLFVVSKRESYSRLYRAAASALVGGATVTLEYKATLPWGWATGGDISPDGDEIVIRGYLNATLWCRPPGTAVWDAFATSGTAVPLASEPQGEAIAFDAAGWGYYTVSEGTYPPLYYYDRVPPPTGDLNCSGEVDLADIPHFVQALLDPAGYAAAHDCSPYPACNAMLADMNGDGRADGGDIRLFVNALIAG
jgi:hypothetical protein